MLAKPPIVADAEAAVSWQRKRYPHKTGHCRPGGNRAAAARQAAADRLAELETKRALSLPL